MAQMEKVIEAEECVETVHAGTVCDNVSCNRTDIRLIEEKCPKLFTPGCCTHVADLLIEDIYKTPAFKKITNDCHFFGGVHQETSRREKRTQTCNTQSKFKRHNSCAVP